MLRCNPRRNPRANAATDDPASSTSHPNSVFFKNSSRRVSRHSTNNDLRMAFPCWRIGEINLEGDPIMVMLHTNQIKKTIKGFDREFCPESRSHCLELNFLLIRRQHLNRFGPLVRECHRSGEQRMPIAGSPPGLRVRICTITGLPF